MSQPNEFDNAAKRAVARSIAARADGLDDDGAFWRAVERSLGKEFYAALTGLVADECSRRLRLPRVEYVQAMGLLTLREAAMRRVS